MSRRLHRYAAAAAIAVVGLAGLSLASASQLSVDGRTLQAGTAVVGDCQPAQTPVSVSFTSTFSGGAYTTTAVRVGNVDAACNGLTYRLQLVNAAGAQLDSNPASGGSLDMTATVALTGGAFTVVVPPTPTASIARVALVIFG